MTFLSGRQQLSLFCKQNSYLISESDSMETSANLFAELTLKKFNSLPKTGKPTKSEWTVLSSIIQVDSITSDTKVVALGCGTKCIGKSKLCPLGLVLNDSHAEVLARRGFLRYVFHQLKSKSDSVFTKDEKSCVFRIKDSLRFHFFSTQVPCGDACIVCDDSHEQIPTKRIKLDNDHDNFDVGEVLSSSKVFTGAKLIGGNAIDPMHQSEGCLRTKPGRGDRTLSMSCSDKLSKWNILGIQGAFLDVVLEKPIYLESLSFACEFDMDSMNRAIYERWKDRAFKNERFVPQKPTIHRVTNFNFEFAQDPDKNPSPNGLVWCDVPDQDGSYEISVNGRKQGITKKMIHTKKSSLKISKFHFLEEICELLRTQQNLRAKLDIEEEDLETKTYLQLKKMCHKYQTAWEVLKDTYFQQWTTKPDNLLDFTKSSVNKKS